MSTLIRLFSFAGPALFHSAMKFKAAENAVRGCKVIDSLERDELEREIQGAKWLVWHGKGGKAVARIKALDDRLLARAGYEFCTLWWNLCRLGGYITSKTMRAAWSTTACDTDAARRSAAASLNRP